MRLAPRLREAVARRARTVPLVTRLIARDRKRKYDQRIEFFLQHKDGRAGRLLAGVVYETTMRCNLHCEFGYVGGYLTTNGPPVARETAAVEEAAVPDAVLAG